MNFIFSNDSQKGTKALAQALAGSLEQNKKVLWLVPGGSNISISIEVMKMLENSKKHNLTVTLTDERYGLVGHPDSNWKQLADAGFDFKEIQQIPALCNVSLELSLEETVKKWSQEMEKAFNENDIIIGQFGIGPDGHIAGILPHSLALSEKSLVCGYESHPFTRITLTFSALRKVDQAFVFAFGDSKKKALIDLQQGIRDITDEPARILSEIKEVQIYTDQLVD